MPNHPVHGRKRPEMSKYEKERAMKIASPKPNPNVIVKKKEKIVVDNSPIKKPSWSSVHVVKRPEKSKYEMEREKKAASPKPNPNIIKSPGLKKKNIESTDKIRAVKQPEKSKYEIEREIKAASPKPNPNVINSPGMKQRKLKPMEEVNSVRVEAEDLYQSSKNTPKESGVNTPTTAGWTRKSPLGSPCPERRVPAEEVARK